MIEWPEEPPAIDYDQLPLFSGFIVSEHGNRVASAFIVRVELGVTPWAQYFSHAHLVTALHAVFDKQIGEFRKGLLLEFPWMEEQGLARNALDNYLWSFAAPIDLPGSETVLDIAVAPLTMSAFSGVQFGRSTRALPIELLEFKSSRLLGRETVSAGLFFPYSGNSNKIEPVLRFGRIASMPEHPLRSDYGVTEAVLVESSSAEGMSGAPVFVRDALGHWTLVGVHVGHFNTAGMTFGPTESHKYYSHASVGIVAPAWRLANDLICGERLTEWRKLVDSEIERFPWRFIDRRHRESRGVVLSEAFYEDMTEYVESGDDAPWDYLFYILQVPGGYDYEFVRGDELEWNTDVPARLGPCAKVVKSIQDQYGVISWIREESRLRIGTMSLEDQVVRVFFFVDDDEVLVIRVVANDMQLTDQVIFDLRNVIAGKVMKCIDVR